MKKLTKAELVTQVHLMKADQKAKYIDKRSYTGYNTSLQGQGEAWEAGFNAGMDMLNFLFGISITQNKDTDNGKT